MPTRSGLPSLSLASVSLSIWLCFLQGAFSQLTDEDLQWLHGTTEVGSGRPFVAIIPKLSRARIVALAESVRRRLQKEDKDAAQTQQMKIEAQLLQEGKILGLVLGNDDEDGDGACVAKA